MKSVMRQLSTNITLVNDTLSKKLQWLAEDEGKDHKSVIGLEDLSQNVSARLTTLEGSCVKSAVHSALNNTVGNLSLQVTNGEKELSKLSGKVTELQTQVNHLERNETLLLSQISRIISKPSLDIPASSEAVSSLQLQTTEGTEVSGDDSPSQSAFN
ncbi:hypothetical protein B7P43_G06473 [Cryptotermes secundus]|uniref:Uncharacterized protein n=2 Tax=Cryptotermes secundus TaxID=105785 RepID=A0A2J7RN20_9NEOP|nr:hypothetical protein B7P43_G06473 [Cryptotermes secundus]